MSIRVTLRNIEASWLQEQIRLKNSCHHEIPTLHLKELMNARHPEYTANTQEYLKIAGHPSLETPLTSMVISISSGEFRIVNFVSFLVFWKWVRGAYFLISQHLLRMEGSSLQGTDTTQHSVEASSFFIPIDAIFEVEKLK